jgi:ADP-ribose pyrophosphatase YjhB (NUDIX family)
VGVLVWRDARLLLIERRLPPPGLAPPAGHVDSRRSFEQAAIEELAEEVGLIAHRLTLLAQGRQNNPCRRIDGNWHYWKIYKAVAAGAVVPNPRETRGADWYSKEQIAALIKLKEHERLRLEDVWRKWFTDLKLIERYEEYLAA